MEEHVLTPQPETPEAPQKRDFWDILAACTDFLLRWGWLALLSGSIILIGYYVLFPSRGYFHSDTTDTLMWGAASAASDSLFNHDFAYACLLPFSTSLVMWPLAELFGVTMTAHVIGMLIFFLCFTGALIWMLRSMQWSWGWVSAGVAMELMMLSGSEKLREIFWGHTIYYSLGILFVFVGLGLLFRFMEQQEQRELSTEGTKKKKHLRKMLLCIVLTGLWFLLACTNQIIAIAIFALPVMAAWFCERWLDTKTDAASARNRWALLMLLVMGTGTVTGHLLTKLLARGITAEYETSFSTFSAMDTWLENAQKFPLHWVELIGVRVQEGTHLMSASSVLNLLLLIASVVILILPAAALFFYQKIEDAKLRILILTYWFMTLLIMIGYVCGMLSIANWRLSPIAAMAVLVSVAFLRWAVSQIRLQRLTVLLMLPVMAVCFMNALTICRMPWDNYRNNILYQLSDQLEEYDLDYGYATFWRANGITVVSDSRVECRSVTISKTGLKPYHYQSCQSWFEAQPGQENYFLLMTKAEMAQVEQACPELAERKTQEIALEGYFVWIFEENIFS